MRYIVILTAMGAQDGDNSGGQLGCFCAAESAQFIQFIYFLVDLQLYSLLSLNFFHHSVAL